MFCLAQSGVGKGTVRKELFSQPNERIDYSQTATINGQIVNISDTTQFAKVLWQHILQGESQ
ncbi:hypothetical protein LSPH24S_02578 [Lysinibacillus sphaericus]